MLVANIKKRKATKISGKTRINIGLAWCASVGCMVTKGCV